MSLVVTCCELYDEKKPWDVEISVGLKKFQRRIEKLVSDINSAKIELLRSLPLAQGSITAINIYVFVDASIVADYPAGYAVIMYQANSVIQGLVTSKSRISKLLQFQDSN